MALHEVLFVGGPMSGRKMKRGVLAPKLKMPTEYRLEQIVSGDQKLWVYVHGNQPKVSTVLWMNELAGA